MPDGGRLVIEADNAMLDEEYVDDAPGTPSPGTYVRLKVSDTGVGMDEETVQRAFEPFFTTKGKGEGTGLGLATVYGIVTGAGGRIDIYSEPGMGTTVKIHLPASAAAPTPDAGRVRSRPLGRGEVVLVVEDEPDVRRMAERILTKGGYSVIGASGGEEALEVCERADQPDRSGPHRRDHAGDARAPSWSSGPARLRPELAVIFMSGYSHEVLAPGALTERGGHRVHREAVQRATLAADARRERALGAARNGGAP